MKNKKDKKKTMEYYIRRASSIKHIIPNRNNENHLIDDKIGCWCFKGKGRTFNWKEEKNGTHQIQIFHDTKAKITMYDMETTIYL